MQIFSKRVTIAETLSLKIKHSRQETLPGFHQIGVDLGIIKKVTREKLKNIPLRGSQNSRR